MDAWLAEFRQTEAGKRLAALRRYVLGFTHTGEPPPLLGAASRRRKIALGSFMIYPGVQGLPAPVEHPVEPGQMLPSVGALKAWAKGLDRATRRLRYPNVEVFARDIGLAEEALIASYELENIFHDKILAEASIDVRRALNAEVYTKAFEIYAFEFKIDLDAKSSPKDELVRLLQPELEGRSILDVGCGGGAFLLSCARNLKHRDLLGLDVFAKDLDVPERMLSFKRSDVVRFRVDTPFDVAVTDNVYEHIAPQDIDEHLQSVRAALKPGGKVVILTPHRYFGPWDVTRIVDNSNSGWLPARGTHINEVTYGELAAKLTANGFGDLQTVPPKVRLGYKTSPARVPLDLFCRAERRPGLVRRLQSMDKRYRYPAFEILVTARRV
jgi:2-polyprenyl-3-methyl-5-hydroxy-6-metoxy-1,4-benzoquinol methylase